MAKRYRVISQAETARGKDVQTVIEGLTRLGLTAEQAEKLLEFRVVVKQDLDKAKALQYIEKFAEAGLQLRLDAYDVEDSPDSKASEIEAIYTLLESTFAQPLAASMTTRAYKQSFAVAVMASLAAPLIYGLLLLAVTGALYWYFAVGHSAWFGDSPWHGHYLLTLWIMTWVVPAVAGLILIVFLLYPLWPQGEEPTPMILDRKQYARFYTLMDKMSRAMGVPAPAYIRLDAYPNASAGPVKGMVSLARGELSLGIGLSFVMGMTVEQFLGVIAHEFGHFSQRSSMMAYVWINRVNHWLFMCAHGQDHWAGRFRAWKLKYDHEIVQASLWVSEKLLIVVRALFRHLFDLNLRLTKPMSRQMEYDADLYQTRLVGSHKIHDLTIKARSLSWAWQAMGSISYQTLHQSDRLPRNLPAAVQSLVERMTPQLKQQIEESLQVEETRYWDTHPASMERIQHAEQANEPGRLHCDAPAHLLFPEIDRLCENATLYHYHLSEISGAREFVVDNAILLADIKF